MTDDAIPSSPAGYLPTLPKIDGIPAGTTIDASHSKYLEAAEQAHKAGLTQRQFSAFLGFEAQRVSAAAKAAASAPKPATAAPKPPAPPLRRSEGPPPARAAAPSAAPAATPAKPYAKMTMREKLVAHGHI